MQKKKWEILNIIKQEIFNNIKSYVIVTIIFTVGLFLGVLFINQTESKDNISQYINTYIDETKTIQTGNFFEELKNDIKSNILLVFLLWFSGTTIIGIPIVFGIILARGFCLGYTISACITIMGTGKGLSFVLIALLLQNIIFIPAILGIAVSGLKLYKSIVKDKRKENVKIEILRHTIFSLIMLIVLAVASIIEIFISTNLLKGLIKYF